MSGDTRRRFCDRCGKHVHDISAGTEEEARELFREAGSARLCVRFTRDVSGAVRFALPIVAAVSMTACSATLEQPKTEVEVEMGDMVLDRDDQCPDDMQEDPSGDGCIPKDAGARQK